MFFPLDLDAHADLDVSMRVVNANDVRQEPRTFIEVNPRNSVGDQVAEKRVIALADDAETVPPPASFTERLLPRHAVQ